MKCTKALFLYVLKFILAVFFIILFIQSIFKLALNEKGTKFSVEDGDFILPSLNICPTYNESLMINIKDNYTLEDLEQLPSMLSLLKPELQIYDRKTYETQ